MSKAVISNRIYMDLPESKQELFDALTYKIVTKDQRGQPKTEIVRNYRMVTPHIISLPQGRTDLIPHDYTTIDKRVLHFADFPAPKLDLFEEQKVIYDQAHESCFINAKVGFGKTFLALHIARNLGQKTLVITHTSALRDQWIEEVEKLYGITPGIIGGGKFNSDSPIVVGNVQSLVKQMDHIAKEYGTLIMDEAHHTPATTFTNIINECHGRYRIALSGTMLRKDGKHIMFPDYFGFKVFKPPQNNTLNPTIKLLKTGIKLPPGKCWSDKVTALLQDAEYQDLIASIALVQANKGHKVLVIADRTDFLIKVNELLGDRSICIIGETKDRKAELEKLYNEGCDVLCGSRNIFSEGISQNNLSCVVLAIPIANDATLEQIIGRIQRLYPGKLDPVVIDLQFSGPSEVRQNNQRLAFYLQQSWKIESL